VLRRIQEGADLLRREALDLIGADDRRLEALQGRGVDVPGVYEPAEEGAQDAEVRVERAGLDRLAVLRVPPPPARVLMAAADVSEEAAGRRWAARGP
jgi:hypothetical protein